MRICIVIIFNHKYEKNLQKLREIYAGKFSYIRFILPFYQGESEDVISVYESSYQFNGYIAQAYPYLKSIDCDGFFFVADDMIINPALDENAMSEHFQKGTSYISEYKPLNLMSCWGQQKLFDTMLCFQQKHTNYKPELLDAEKAFQLSEEKGYHDWSIRSAKFYSKESSVLRNAKALIYRKFIVGTQSELPYPLMGAYSDIFLIWKQNLKEICHAFGVMAAMGIFVEIAIPTCLFLYSSKLETFTSLGFKGNALWGG